MAYARPRGMADILPGESEKWRYLEETFHDLARRYGYHEIRTPALEHSELFHRGLGEATDIVEKETYTFLDRAGRSLTLRPEGTAPVVRAFLEGGLDRLPQPVKLYYLGAMFRYGRPQAGRLREFNQLGVEVFGSRDPLLDAEVISLAAQFYQNLGLPDVEIRLNSIGCPQCRPLYREKLRAYLEPKRLELCPTCRDRLDRSPMRVLDCKSPDCRNLASGAPVVTGFLCQDCSGHFLQLRRALAALGVVCVLDPGLVRGLDYYTNTAFEFIMPQIGAQSSIGGGGRYNGLVESCGGPPTPGVGFGLGVERTLLALEARGIDIPPAARTGGRLGGVFVATAGQAGSVQSVVLLQELRKNGFRAEKDYLGRSLKAQLKHADRWGADRVLILGEEELSRGVVTVRDMDTSEQREVNLPDVVAFL